MFFKNLLKKGSAYFGRRPVLDQAAIDTYRATLLLRCQEWCSEQVGRHSQPSQKEVDMFYDEAQGMSEEEMNEFNKKRLNKQIIDLFSKVRVEMGSDYEGNASLRQKLDVESKLSDDTDVEEDEDTTDEEEEEEDEDDDSDAYGIGNVRTNTHSRTGSLMRSVGFDLEKRRSNIPSAGMGVFVNCDESHVICAGTVIALFPGLVHLQEFTQQGEYIVKNLLPDDDLMLMARSDGHIIDGRTADECAPNPYAFAHLVNHVPQGEMPNVLQCPYDYPSDPLGMYEFPKSLRRYIPNSYAKKPTTFGTIDRSAFMHGMVLIAARPLSKGDELIMDYRLNPKAGQLPVWYQHYNDAEAKSRWSQ
jgi:hypothetical protein